MENQAESGARREMRTSDAADLTYRQTIIDRLDRQTIKGIEKYGATLDQNPKGLTLDEQLEYLSEELTDGLVYIERLRHTLRDLKVIEKGEKKVKYIVTLKITVDAETSTEALLKAMDERNHPSDYQADVKEAKGPQVIYD